MNMAGPSRTWAEYVGQETLFTNAIRLRHLIWTIEHYVRPESRLLEVGFGSGTTAVLLADMGYAVTAVDLSPEVVAAAQARYAACGTRGTLQFQEADMRHLPWREQRFALAYHQGVLEHCQDDLIITALAEQARVAPRIVFDVPNARYDAQPFGDERLMPIRRWRALIRRAGLRIERVVGRGFPTWTHLLPSGLFSRRGVSALPGLSARLGSVSIFVCVPAVDGQST